MSSSKKEPRWKTDKSWYGHPDYHMAFLVISAAAIIIAGAVFAFCLSMRMDYITAKYKLEVEATLTDIRQGETEKWAYTENGKEEKDPRYRETRTYTETIYGYYWEYEINGEKQVWHNTESSASAHKIGDTMTMKMWSSDGEEYHRSWYGAVSTVIMYLSAGVILVALYLIIRILIVKMQMKAYYKKRRR